MSIRRSLACTLHPTPSLRPVILNPRLPESTASETEHFLSELNKLSGKAQRLEPANIFFALQNLVAEQNIRKATVWNTPRLNQYQITNYLSSLGVELISPNSDKHTLAQYDLGITEADYLLPKTGTLVLHSSAEKLHVVSLAPRVHLAIVHPTMLHADLHQIFAEAKDSNYLVFITGPSRTADIGLTVTLGVHNGDSQKPCTCAPAVVTKYQKRISDLLLDRIDIHIEVPRVDYEKLSGNKLGETSETFRKRVQITRDIQTQRYSSIRTSNTESSNIVCNADMRIGEVRQFCQLQPEGQSLMRAAMSQLNLSARAYHRILKLSRTIADLAGSEEIQSPHLAEALQYRPKLMIG